MRHITFDDTITADPVKLAKFLNILRRGMLELQSPITTLDIAKADKRTQVVAGAGLKGGGALQGDVRVDLTNTGVTPGTYTNPIVTVDAQGRVTIITSGAGNAVNVRSGSVAITPAGTAVTFMVGGVPLAFINNNYVIIVTSCVNASGEGTEVELTSQTKDGFLATSPFENAQLDYIALQADFVSSNSGINAITPAGTPITFAKQFPDTEFVTVVASCVNALGESVGVELSGQSVSGFTATPTENAVLYWLAIHSTFAGARIATVPIVSGGTLVTLPTPYLDALYTVYPVACVNALGESVGVQFSGRTLSQFTATPLENASLTYLALHFT